MSTEIRQQAEQAAKMVDELNAIVLPEPSTALVPLGRGRGADRRRHPAPHVRDRHDGYKLHRDLRLRRAGRAADHFPGHAGRREEQGCGPRGRHSLREIVGTIRGFSVDELNPNRKQSWWERLFGKAKPLHDFLAKHENVKGQIDKITDDLLRHEHVLMKDIKALDQLYEKTLDFYDELALYISAGEEKLKELDEKDIPAKEPPRSRPRRRMTR